MRIIALLLLVISAIFLMTSSSLSAQQVRLAEPKMGHTIFGQLFWEYKDYYLSYDKLWLRKWRYFHLSTSVGFWYTCYDVHPDLNFKRSWNQRARVQFSALAGKSGHYAIAGYTRWHELFNGREPDGPLCVWEESVGDAHIGYRFQHPNGGFFIQGLMYLGRMQSVAFTDDSFSIGVGITLPVKPKRAWRTTALSQTDLP